jgi:CubicO group peptidase (beta-lactamase class C family)
MFERVFTPVGITRGDLKWRDNQYRPKLLNSIPRREFGSGIHANVDAMARLGLMYNRAGRVNSRQVLPLEFVAALRQPVRRVTGLLVLKEEDYPNASNHYGLLWWNNGDGHIPGVPRDAFWTWGLYDRHIIVIPSLDLIVARAGKPPTADTGRSRIKGLDANGRPDWTKDIAQRAVFENAPRGVYRTQVTYNSGLKALFDEPDPDWQRLRPLSGRVWCV